MANLDPSAPKKAAIKSGHITGIATFWGAILQNAPPPWGCCLPLVGALSAIFAVFNVQRSYCYKKFSFGGVKMANLDPPAPKKCDHTK